MNQLGVVKNIVEEAGLGISYAYEDLVFLDHNSYLLQFTDKEQKVFVCINKEADLAALAPEIARLTAIAIGHKMKFVGGDQYTLSEADDESVTIEFYES